MIIKLSVADNKEAIAPWVSSGNFKFKGNHNHLVKRYGVSVSQMTTGMFPFS